MFTSLIMQLLGRDGWDQSKRKTHSSNHASQGQGRCMASPSPHCRSEQSYLFRECTHMSRLAVTLKWAIANAIMQCIGS